ncbi:hypothetical protein COHA_003190 [Chlorella ohadii]|uniref:Uncharacterized protein n=1 Tax=Chlorella ohadii TaxID=2649997 RepID=A0AAD5DZ97_9CHLO|nr:hypothetical protein COHA_003190 [Chlorella ohadii]
MTRREVVAVANTATLEAAVRGCMEDGATKVMVVPYCTSLEFQPDANPTMALAEVQSRLPGIRCMMGETISVSTMLAEVIESQVKVVDGRRPDVAERWFTPEPRAVNRPTWSDWQHTQHSAAGAAGAQRAQQAEQAQAHAAAIHHAEAAVNGSSSAPRAWSDDFSSVMVVDYRPKPGSQPVETASTAVGANGHTNDWAGVGTTLAGSSSSTAHGAPFADWAGDGSADGQPLFEGALDKRLTGIEDQLQRIAGLLEMMPKSQQAQQAALHLETDDEDDKTGSAVSLRLPPPKPKKPFILRLLRGQP